MFTSAYVTKHKKFRFTIPHYVAAHLRRLSDMPSKWCLRSSLSDQLDVCQSQHLFSCWRPIFCCG